MLIGRKNGYEGEPQIGRTLASPRPFRPLNHIDNDGLPFGWARRYLTDFDLKLADAACRSLKWPGTIAWIKDECPVRRYGLSFLDHRRQRFRGSCTEKVTVKSGSVTTSFVERRQ